MLHHFHDTSPNYPVYYSFGCQRCRMPVPLINNLVKLHAEPHQGSASGTTGAGPNLQRVGQADEDHHPLAQTQQVEALGWNPGPCFLVPRCSHQTTEPQVKPLREPFQRREADPEGCVCTSDWGLSWGIGSPEAHTGP